MTSRWLWLGLGGASALYIFSKLGKPSGFPSFVSKKLITKSKRDAEGFVLDKPADLAKQAGLDIETYTLARFLGSEYSSGNFTEKAGIAWAIRNRARQRGWTLLRLATETTKYGNRGLYGSQEHGRFASTSRDPTGRDAYVAAQVLAGAVPDPTGGSDKFFDPQAQTALHKTKPELYRSVADLIAKWQGEGSEIVRVSGTDSSKLVFFRPRRA